MAQVEDDAVARMVRFGRGRRVREGVDDSRCRVRQLVLPHAGKQGAEAPVVGHSPRGAAQVPEEALHGIGACRDALQVGQWARRGLRRVEEADDLGDLLGVVAREQTGLEQTPVPRRSRPREQEDQQVALGQ